MRRLQLGCWTLCTVLAMTVAAKAQDRQAEQEPVENRYRVGIDCAPIDEALQQHLRLDQGTGLIVNSLLEGSPAERAGLKRLDVIIQAGERPVGSVEELVGAVNEAGTTELALVVIRRGEPMSLTVTPEERDAEEMEQLRRGFQNQIRRPGWQGFGAIPPEIQKRLEQFGPLDDFFRGEDFFGGRGFRRVLPGIIMDEQPPGKKLPHGFNLNMKVERSGDEPAKITIQQDDKTWEVTEDHLDDLPEDLRPIVENMLNGRNSNWPPGLAIPGDQGPVLPSPEKSGENDDSQLKQRFDGLELQLQELQNAIRSLKQEK